MANTRNDDLDRNGNRSTPQGSTQGRDPINRDRQMNRDGNLGQGSSGTEQGRDGSYGSTGKGTMGSDPGSDRDRQSGNRTTDTGKRPPDVDE